MKTKTICMMSLGLAACGSPAALEDARHPTGSQALAPSADYSALYVANEAEGSVARIAPDARERFELPLDGEPTRVARSGGRVFVSLRAARQVAVLVDEGGRLTVEARIDVGHEPFGVVVSEDGARVYVASSLSNRVDEIDAATLELLRTWSVEDEPRWLAWHPSGALYVGSAWQGSLTYIDLASGERERLGLPERRTFGFETGEEVSLDARITGDPAVTPDGRHLAIPAAYFDTQNPIQNPTAEPDGFVRPPEGGGYTNRITPVVALVPVEANGRPKMDDAELVPVTGFLPEGGPVAGYPASVTIDPRSEMALATVEGADAVIALPLEAPDSGGGLFGNLFDEVDAFGGNFSFRPSSPVSTDAGPRGVAFTGDDRAFVYGFLDRTVQRIEAAPLRASVVRSEDDVPPLVGGQAAVAAIPTTRSTLPPAVEAGRRLFYSSADNRMSQQGSGVSCATCHFDGRTDGLTWTFDTGERQTPSLAGQVSSTEPVRWEGDRATVEDDTRMTSQGLMGGTGIDDSELESVAAFIDWTRDVDSPLKASSDPRVARGKAIFERDDVGCARCHSGPRYTDNQSYTMFGMDQVQTRSLVGVAGSPPYLHDGSAPTLRALLERVRSGEMGSTADLSDRELDDLEAYLRSL